MSQPLETEDKVVIRGLHPEDLESVIRLDAKLVGRRRDEYFKVKLQQNLQETGIKVSLAAEIDGCFCGFCLARVFYGEFGVMEPVAILDTIDVDPDFKGLGAGTALMDQLCANLKALEVRTLRTEAEFQAIELLGFFSGQGFEPAKRLCLDLDIAQRPPRDVRAGRAQ